MKKYRFRLYRRPNNKSGTAIEVSNKVMLDTGFEPDVVKFKAQNKDYTDYLYIVPMNIASEHMIYKLK